MMKKINLMFGIFLLFILMITNAYAFGIASQNGPFTVSPGETKTIKLWLQNMIGDNDITVKAIITNGSEIAEITGKTEYTVKLGTDDTEVPVKIKIPKEVGLNEEYKVTVSFATVTPGQAAGIAFGTGIEKTLTLLVVAEEQGQGVSTTTLTLIIAGIILIIIIVIVLLRKRKAR